MAQGKFGGGTGIAENPYLIEDAEDLSAIRFYPNANFKLAYSINLGVSPYNSGKGWLPIKDFTGTLNGNGKKIYNLFINRPDKNGVGLFESIKNVDGSVQRVYDLGIERADVTGKTNAGVLAGSFTMFQTTGGAPAAYLVDRCYITGRVSAESNGGGLFGVISWDSAAQAVQFNLAQDTLIDVSFQPSAASALFGAIAGTIYNASNKNFNLNYVISASTFSNVINGLANPTLNPLSFGTFSGVNYFNGPSNCIYDSTRWTTGATAGTTAVTTDNLIKTRFTDLDQRILDDGTLIWQFYETMRYPMLRQFYMDRYFVRTADGYCVYENGAWVIKYTTMPTRAQAVNVGMPHIRHIPFSAWDSLRAANGKVDLLNIVELSNGTTQQTTNYALTLDAAASVGDKNYFRKEMKFSDLGNNIVTMNKGVVA